MMFQVIVAALALASAASASADEIYYTDDWSVLTGQSITQTIRISGIDPLLDQISILHFGDVDFGLNWMEDFGNGPEIWGNEYLQFTELTAIGSGTASDGMSFTSPYGTFFLFESDLRLEQDGSDMLATITFRLGDMVLLCQPWMQQYETCGIRPFSAYLFTDILVSGPNEGGAIITISVGPTPAVPEPATWAMLISGFGLVGATLRRKTSAPA